MANYELFAGVGGKPWWERYVVPDDHNRALVKEAAQKADVFRVKNLERLARAREDGLIGSEEAEEAAKKEIEKNAIDVFIREYVELEQSYTFEVRADETDEILERMGIPEPRYRGDTSSGLKIYRTTGFEAGFARGFKLGQLLAQRKQTLNAKLQKERNRDQGLKDKRDEKICKEAAKIKDKDRKYIWGNKYNASKIANAIYDLIKNGEVFVADFNDDGHVVESVTIKNILTANRDAWGGNDTPKLLKS